MLLAFKVGPPTHARPFWPFFSDGRIERWLLGRLRHRRFYSLAAAAIFLSIATLVRAARRRY
jgi:hypothetical protein